MIDPLAFTYGNSVIPAFAKSICATVSDPEELKAQENVRSANPEDERLSKVSRSLRCLFVPSPAASRISVTHSSVSSYAVSSVNPESYAISRLTPVEYPDR